MKRDVINKITKPTLVLSIDRVRKNISLMESKATVSGVVFRPHFKTHQSARIGEIFRELGVKAITVSSVTMAEYFARNNWDDITIAFPVNIREIRSIDNLAGKIKLNLLVEDTQTVSILEKELKNSVNTWIKIDVGTKRTGIESSDFESVLSLVKSINKASKLSLKGLLTHAGHTYHASSVGEIKSIYRETIDKLYELKLYLRKKGYEDILLSIGDTPTCSIVSDFSEVDEIRPGNFVFYDVTQYLLGSCSERHIAVALAAPVVAKHPNRNEIVVYGGAIHLSKDHRIKDGKTIFGLVALPLPTSGEDSSEENNFKATDSPWGTILENSYVKSLSQEHGVIKLEPKYLEKIAVGDIIFILPIHSCLTANLMGRYLTTEGKVIEMMRE